MKSVCVAESVPSMFEGSQMRAHCDGDILSRLEWPEHGAGGRRMGRTEGVEEDRTA